MAGRNFWAEKDGEGWRVREEGLTDATTRHATREDAWEAAKARAQALKGGAFLADENGELRERAWFGDLPRDMKI